MSTGMAFATAPGQQTNQAETVPREAHGMRSDEDPRRQADGILLCDRHHSAGEVE
jgi:hypothetical protein